MSRICLWVCGEGGRGGGGRGGIGREERGGGIGGEEGGGGIGGEEGVEGEIHRLYRTIYNH